MRFFVLSAEFILKNVCEIPKIFKNGNASKL